MTCNGGGAFVRDVLGVDGPYETMVAECPGCPACITLDDLCRPWGPGEAPPLDQLDRAHVELSDDRMAWKLDGLVILPGFMDEDMISFYERRWLWCNGNRPSGWPCDTPYMHDDGARAMCCDEALGDVLADIIGEPCGVHLNLSGWRSTTRNWHQDGYLNPDTTADHYAAVWFALDDIHPDAGPFEYVPGSHREFGVIRQDLMLDALGTTPANPHWPRDSEAILTPLFEQAIDERGMEVRRFLAKRGDVLIWHPRLLHRGSMPNDPTLERRSLIAHYSGIFHRPDMPAAVQHGAGWLFPINQDHGRCGA
jgi:hypothetical protein